MLLVASPLFSPIAASTVAGLVYFLICSPIWLFYTVKSIWMAPDWIYVLVVNAAIPAIFAVTQYPLYVKCYWKRLFKLMERTVSEI
jgi:hypothetical protein